MALKSTVYRVELNVADVDRHYYADHTLTIARHPSETDERMMVRLLVFALYADPALVFGKGLSDADDADLWQRDLTGAIERWIEVGQPDERRIAKACGRAGEVVVCAYGPTARTWWQQNAAKLARFANLRVLALAPEASRALAGFARRTMHVQATITDGEVLVSSVDGSLGVGPETLQAPR